MVVVSFLIAMLCTFGAVFSSYRIFWLAKSLGGGFTELNIFLLVANVFAAVANWVEVVHGL